MSSTERTSNTVLPLLALLFAWAWVVPMSTLPFQGPKAWALVGFGLLALAELMRARGRVPARRARVFLVALLAVLVLSTLTSIAPRVALWGNDDRHMGVGVWLAAGVLGYAWWARQGNPLDLGRVLALGSFLAGGTLLWTRAFPPPADTLLGPLVPGFQTGGTLGNRSFLGVAMAASVPYLVGLAWDAHRKGERAWPWWLAVGWNILFPLAVGSRSAVLGLWAAGLVLGGCALPRRWWRRVWWAAGLGLPTTLLLWAITHPHTRLWDLLHRNGTLVQRLLVWQATLRLFWRAPARVLTGFGADTLGLVFPQVYPAVLIGYEPDRQAHVFDRAHNLVLDLGVQFGAVAVLLLLVMGGLALRRCWARACAADVEPVVLGALAGWLALVLMWQVHFPTPTTLLLAALFVATSLSREHTPIHSSARSADAEPPRTIGDAGMYPGLALALLTLMTLPYGSAWSRAFLLASAAALWGSAYLWSGRAARAQVLFLPAVVAAALWMLAPASWVFMPALAAWGVALLLWAGQRWREHRGRFSPRAGLIWGMAFLALAVVAVRPLAADSFHRAAQVWGGDPETLALARMYGEWAWRLDARERVALTMAELTLQGEDPPTAAAVQRALAWLENAPQPHSAAWWYVRLQVMEVGAGEGIVSQEEVKAAYRAALRYFPGNLLWEGRTR